MKDFEFIPHTADMQLRVYGVSIKDLFCNALRGMFQAMAPKVADCMRSDDTTCSAVPANHDVELQAEDSTLLLIDFLSHALSLSDIHNEAYPDVTVHDLTDTSLRATVHGVPITGFGAPEIKAVTYHDAQIVNVNGVWQVDIVFDI